MRYGYARVSTRDQNPELQLSALADAGCDELRQEQASGAGGRSRPVLTGLLSDLAQGDTLTIWRLDRLGRNTSDLLRIVDDLDRRGIAIRSLGESLDTSTAAGRLVLTVLAAVAQMERERALERIHAGIAVARTRPGYHHGRRPKLSAADVDQAVADRAAGVPQRAIARGLRVSRQSLARALAASDARRMTILAASIEAQS